MVDAIKRAQPRRITAVIPYFGYARQDRRPRSHARADQRQGRRQPARDGRRRAVLTMDLHADQIQGFFDIPVDNIYACRCCCPTCSAKQLREPGRGLARRRRRGAGAGAGQADSAATWRSSTSAARRQRLRSDARHRRDRRPQLRDHGRHDRHRRHAGEGRRGAEGARRAQASTRTARTPVFSGPAIERIRGSQIDEVVITDTIPLTDAARACPKIRQLSVAFLFAETIRRICGRRIGDVAVRRAEQ